MSQVLTLELSDEVYAALQQQAKILVIKLPFLHGSDHHQQIISSPPIFYD
jgi:hypothetical protein